MESAAGFSVKKLRIRSRFLLIGLASIAVLLLVGGFDHALLAPKGVPTVIQELIHPGKRPQRVSLALLQDPIGIIAIIMAFATPIFCAEQIRAIQRFNAMNERNITYRAQSLDIPSIEKYTDSALAQWRSQGRKSVATVLLAVSLGLSFLVDWLINRWGLFAGWNYTTLKGEHWQKEVYQGWWANPHQHLAMAIVFWLVGGYFFYFVIKQLNLGFVFAVYIGRVNRLKFGVSPNMTINTDGYWGLRLLRHFFQTTYSSTMGHFIMILGILVVWLPFNLFSILMVIGVMITNVVVVAYPSVVAAAGIIIEKKKFVKHVVSLGLPRSEQDEIIDKVWTAPNLPFRLGSTFSAATLYLLIPLVLAVVSNILGK